MDWQTYGALDDVGRAKVLVDLAHELSQQATRDLAAIEFDIHSGRPVSIVDRAAFARDLALFMIEKKGLFARSHKDFARRMGPHQYDFLDVQYAAVYLAKGVWPR